MGHTYIFSDIHMGLVGAQEEVFEHFCKRLTKEDSLILLGDILDFWLDREFHFNKYVWPKYDKIIELLRLVDTKDVHYIPGNHDSFVFDVEGFRIGGEQVPGLRMQVDQSGVGLQSLLSLLEQKEMYTYQKDGLGAVATIHYPHYHREIGGRRFLFTHGHYHSQLWQLMDGVPSLPRNAPRQILSGVSALAHANARFLRRLLRKVTSNATEHNSEGKYLDDTNAVQTVTIYVTNDILRSMSARERDRLESTEVREQLIQAVRLRLLAMDDLTNRPERIAEIVDRILAEEPTFHQEYDSPELRCLVNGILASYRWRTAPYLRKTRDQVRRHLLKNQDHITYHLRWHGDKPAVDETPFGKMADFETLIIGHRHKPMLDPAGEFHDNGALLHDQNALIISSLQIDEKGRVDWNVNAGTNMHIP